MIASQLEAVDVRAVSQFRRFWTSIEVTSEISSQALKRVTDFYENQDHLTNVVSLFLVCSCLQNLFFIMDGKIKDFLLVWRGTQHLGPLPLFV